MGVRWGNKHDRRRAHNDDNDTEGSVPLLSMAETNVDDVGLHGGDGGSEGGSDDDNACSIEAAAAAAANANALVHIQEEPLTPEGEKAVLTHRAFVVLGLVLFWYTFSIGLTFYNKWLFKVFLPPQPCMHVCVRERVSVCVCVCVCVCVWVSDCK